MVNSTGQLSVVENMSDGTVRPYAGTIIWSSSDDSIVSVDKNGRLTLNSKGTSTVTATVEDGKTAQCAVTAFDLDGLEIDPSPVSSLPVGTTVQLHAYAIATDGTRTDVTDQAQWFSNKEDIATVTAEGAGTIYKKTDTDSSGAQAVRYWIYPDPYNPNYVVMPENDGSKWVEITELLNGQ